MRTAQPLDDRLAQLETVHLVVAQALMDSDSTGTAAKAASLSHRTFRRRAAELREALGVDTNLQAVACLAACGLVRVEAVVPRRSARLADSGHLLQGIASSGHKGGSRGQQKPI